MTNIKSLFAGLLVTSSLVYGASAAQAGEVGVSNRYSDGYSNSNTHVDFTSYEVHQGVEANWATADKTFTSNDYASQSDTQYGNVLTYEYNSPYSGYNVKQYAVVPTSTSYSSSNQSEVVHSASGFSSSGTYFTEDTATGFTNTTSYSAFNEHTTTAFSNP